MAVPVVDQVLAAAAVGVGLTETVVMVEMVLEHPDKVSMVAQLLEEAQMEQVQQVAVVEEQAR